MIHAPVAAEKNIRSAVELINEINKNSPIKNSVKLALI